MSPLNLIALKKESLNKGFIVLFFIPLLINAQPSTPQFQSFQPVSFQHSSSPSSQRDNRMLRSKSLSPDRSLDQRNLQLLQQGGMTLQGPTNNTRSRQLQELKQLLQEENGTAVDNKKISWSKVYTGKLGQFLQMNPDSFSLTKAIYLTESAWYDNPPSFDEFQTGIQQVSAFVKEIIKREGLPANNNMAINYGIQQLYRRGTKTPLLSYDFDDYLGEKKWSSMFVTKLLQTGKGQCHSMPLLYLAIAEQLQGKAYLSLAPNHSYIQFFDSQGNRHHFECTNGSLVTQTLLMQSTFVNATAIKNNTYLDTLSSRQLYAQCLADLLLGYINKIGYDPTSDRITAQILAIDPNNIVALMTLANLNTWKTDQLRKEAGDPPFEKIAHYPALYASYQTRQASYRRIDATGYQRMPRELYEKWLKSIEQEQNKEALRLEQEKINREIEQLKKMKLTIIHKPKG